MTNLLRHYLIFVAVLIIGVLLSVWTSQPLLFPLIFYSLMVVLHEL